MSSETDSLVVPEMPAAPSRQLDRLLPTSHFSSRYTRLVQADPGTVWAAFTSLTASDLPVARALMFLRSPMRPPLRGSMIDTFPIPVLLRLDGEELVNGRIGQFWKPSLPVAPVPEGDAEAFTAFSAPGWIKAAMSVHLQPAAAATLVTIETRALATDDRARRSFGRYWRLIRLGGAPLIRWQMLRAIARRAERAR